MIKCVVDFLLLLRLSRECFLAAGYRYLGICWGDSSIPERLPGRVISLRARSSLYGVNYLGCLRYASLDIALLVISWRPSPSQGINSGCGWVAWPKIDIS